MHHLDEVARAARPDVCNAWSVVNLGGYSFPDGTDMFVRFAIAARHQAGTPQRALLAARDPGTDKVEAFGLQGFFAPLSIDEIRIAAVDDDVPCFEERLYLIDCPVHRIAGLDQ